MGSEGSKSSGSTDVDHVVSGRTPLPRYDPSSDDDQPSTSGSESKPKDNVVFLNSSDARPSHKDYSSLLLSEDDDEPKGAILKNGDINWSCPCMSTMVAGPCGWEFRQAFGCFFKSTADPKGSDCFEHMERMYDCLAQYPRLYASSFGDNGDDEDLFDLEKDKNE